MVLLLLQALPWLMAQLEMNFIIKEGLPSFHLTINPADVYNPIV
jgi:hypothetical protein